MSWPALSESARASPKSLSIDSPSSKAASVELVPNSQVRLEISPVSEFVRQSFVVVAIVLFCLSSASLKILWLGKDE